MKENNRHIGTKEDLFLINPCEGYIGHNTHEGRYLSLPLNT